MTSGLSLAGNRQPLMTRVSEFETSPEWINLTCDIYNLESLQTPTKVQLINEEINCNKIPRTEKNFGKLSSNDTRHSDKLNDNIKNTNKKNTKNWCVIDDEKKKQTEFEKNYFYNNDNDSDYDGFLNGTKVWYDEKKNREMDNVDMTKGYIKGSNTFYDENKILPVQTDTKTNLLFSSYSVEYHESRERLQEIFQHNKLLRQQFFSNIPITKKTSNNVNKNTEKYSKGFGSTETLTSQSGSSNGQNTRPDFSTSPELIGDHDDTSSFNDTKKSKSQFNGGNKTNKYIVSNVTNDCTEFDYSECVHLPCQSSFQAVSCYTDNQTQKQQHNGSADSLDQTHSDYIHPLISNEEEFFATFVTIQDENEDGGVEKNDLTSNLNLHENDLTSKFIVNNVDDEFDDKKSTEDFINTDLSADSLAVIKKINSKSLINLNNNDYSSSHADFSNKSYNDLSNTDDLQSPKLVNNLNNSMIDLNASENSQVQRSQYGGDMNDADHRKSSPGTGITLPSFYGPIPYSQYPEHIQHFFFFFTFFFTFFHSPLIYSIEKKIQTRILSR